jgi:hypothetical protein
MTEEQIKNIFTYHAPFGTQTTRYQILRSEAKSLALTIQEACPESREKSLALTYLQQATMWANAAIAINEKPPALDVAMPTTPAEAAEIFMRYGNVGMSVEDLLGTAPTVGELNAAVMKAQANGAPANIINEAAKLIGHSGPGPSANR